VYPLRAAKYAAGAKRGQVSFLLLMRGGYPFNRLGVGSDLPRGHLFVGTTTLYYNAIAALGKPRNASGCLRGPGSSAKRAGGLRNGPLLA